MNRANKRPTAMVTGEEYTITDCLFSGSFHSVRHRASPQFRLKSFAQLSGYFARKSNRSQLLNLASISGNQTDQAVNDTRRFSGSGSSFHHEVLIEFVADAKPCLGVPVFGNLVFRNLGFVVVVIGHGFLHRFTGCILARG